MKRKTPTKPRRNKKVTVMSDAEVLTHSHAIPDAPRVDNLQAVPEPLFDADTGGQITSPFVDSIFDALAKSQGEAGAALRSRTGTTEKGESYDYAELNDIIEAVRAVASKNGLLVIERFPIGTNYIHAILAHSSGQWIDYGCYDLGSFKTHQEKAAAVTLSRRQIRQAIFGVATKGQDTDASGVAFDADGKSAMTNTYQQQTPEQREEHFEQIRQQLTIEKTIRKDGSIDLDTFAEEYEFLLGEVTNLSELTTLQKVNHELLNMLELHNQKLFRKLCDIAGDLAQKFI